MVYEATIFKPCEKKCGTCKRCKDFDKVLREMDLSRTSPSERQRLITLESRKDHR